MQNPYYEMTVPLFKRMLISLDHLLDKGAAFATLTGMTEEELLTKKLAPDMFDLRRQIQIASDNAKGATARLAQIEAPVMEDSEVTVADLHARIAKTIAFLDSVNPSQFENAGTAVVTLKYFPEKHFLGHDYLSEYALPNFFFHVNTAYSILRSIGVELGKSDYLPELSLKAD